jgi:hypothetical protein
VPWDLPDDYHPTRIVRYANGKGRGGGHLALAEFRWSAEIGVTLTILSGRHGLGALRYLEQGVNLDPERRMAMPAEGPVFMRALLWPRNSSAHFWFVDESKKKAQ